MVIAFGRCASLASLLLVLSAMSTLVRSQAPGDAAGQTCDEPAVPDGVFRLLDAGWYQTLLTGGVNNAGWTQTPAGSWVGAGSFCTRRLESSCDVSDAWVVTQYINKVAVVDYAVQITVAVEGDSSSSGSIKVHYFPSNGPITSNAQLNPANYNFIKSLSFTPSSEEKLAIFSLGSQYDRFYIAIEVEKTCFKLRGLKVSYNVCRSDPEGLVVYPDTPVGTSATTVSAMCKNNAIVSSGSSLSITCNPNGMYSGSPSCSCDGGHFESGQSCHACAANYYSIPGSGICEPCPGSTTSEKGSSNCDCPVNSYMVSLNKCQPCPSNSFADVIGLDECTCVTDYYRTSSDDPSEPCTREPTKPLNLNATPTDTSVTLSWEPPVSTGGREDLFYIIKYKASSAGQYNYSNPTPPITNTSVTVSSLAPLTTYTFMVIAENGVSQEFSDEFLEDDRTSSPIFVVTNADGPCSSSSAAGAIVASVFVTGIIAAAVAVAITIAVCLLIQKRQQKSSSTTSCGNGYDRKKPEPYKGKVAYTSGKINV